MTMITSSTSVITQFTLLLSAVGGAPAAFRVSASAFWSQPSTVLSPIVVTTLPVAGIEVNDRPCFVRKAWTRSKSENLLKGPTKRWKLHSLGLAATVILVLSKNASSDGLT